MDGQSYEVMSDHPGVPVKSWTVGVAFDEEARRQLRHLASLPFIYRWVAAMPDVHVGKGATIGSVVPTLGAVIPAAVGVDIGCGMMAVKSSLSAAQLPDQLAGVRAAIEAAVPHGSAGWNSELPADVAAAWGEQLAPGFRELEARHPVLTKTNNAHHLGTLGSGNHFIEVCLDEAQQVWFMLHSGSRGVGNRIGNHFIALAQREMERWMIQLPDRNLAYLPEGSELFGEYVAAVGWAQEFARINREVMMARVIAAVRASLGIPFQTHVEAINCHHNYVTREQHYGKAVWITRKGAVRARHGELGIIPGSMGERSFIVRGLGNEESFHSCSHGAGRAMSRSEAKRRITLEEHVAATAGVECRKDSGVIDETPAAYKPIDAVMAAQTSLVEVVHTLRQVVCVKG